MVSGFELILPFFPEGLQQLVLDPSVSDICVNGASGVFAERNGHMMRENCEIDADRLNAAIEQIARRLGQDINEKNAVLDTRLPNGDRVAAVYPPASPGGATLTIRKFSRWFSTAELVEMGTLPEKVRTGVVTAVLNYRNVLISGGTGSGKTTALNAFLGHVPASDRIVVIEKPMELDIRQDNAVRWEAVDELPGRPAITVAQLVAASLRHRPDRIVVGEVRDHSAWDLLQALNTGHSGSLSTVHADSATLALYRIADLALSAHSNLDQRFVREQTAYAIHFVLHMARRGDGIRQVTQFLGVRGYQDQFVTEELYAI